MKTLRDKLAKLTTPLPDIDPEQASIDSMGFTASHQSQEMDHYESVSRSKLRDTIGLHPSDPAYAGRKTSRKELEEDFSNDDFEEDSDVNSDNDSNVNSDNDSNVNSDNDSEEDFEQDYNINSEIDEEMSQNSQESNNESSENSESEIEEDETIDDANEHVKNAIRNLQKDEEELVHQLADTVKDELEKGRHVRSQMTLFEGFLESRIKLQKAVNAANRFPKPDTFLSFMSEQEESTLSKLWSVFEECASTVEDLAFLKCSLISQNKEVKEKVSVPAIQKRKRSEVTPTSMKDIQSQGSQILSQLCQLNQDIEKSFKNYRRDTLEKWGSKIQTTAAATLLAQKKFKAINQGIISQIDNVLADKERLVKRCRLNRSSIKPINDQSKPSEEEYDQELFDDGDYYQVLLKDFIESKMGDTNDPIALSMKVIQLKQLQQKKKKKGTVDTKASKGRKIRYHVHEKIESFMVPEPRGTWHEEMSEELFKGLFGSLRAVEDPNGTGDIMTTDGFTILAR